MKKKFFLLHLNRCNIYYEKYIMKKWKIILFLWKSWSGHTTMMNMALNKYPQLKFIRSYTTRDIRKGEESKSIYNFISKQEFQKGIEEWEFLEYAILHNLYYSGTKRSEVQKVLDSWNIWVKEVDIQWLEQIKKDWSFDVFSIFFDIDEVTMKKRILNRAPISEEELRQRIFSAKKEWKNAKLLCDEILDASGTIEDNWVAVSKVLNKIIK